MSRIVPRIPEESEEDEFDESRELHELTDSERITLYEDASPYGEDDYNGVRFDD